MDNKKRRQLQFKCRKMLKGQLGTSIIPEEGSKLYEPDFIITFLEHELFFGDSIYRFEAKDRSSKDVYSISLTRSIRSEKNSWVITEKK